MADAPSHPSHAIATEAAMLILSKGQAAGLSWSEIAITIENAIVIVVCGCAAMSGTPQPETFVKEVIDTATERAHVRAIEYFARSRDA